MSNAKITPTETDDDEDHMAFLCACKGEPYTAAEWEQEVIRLEHALTDAQERHLRAEQSPTLTCPPRRFDHA